MKHIIVGLAMLSSVIQAVDHEVEYPEGYRTWMHLKSMVINQSHSLSDPFEGIHHIYANDKAQKGLELNSYEDGATFVFDLLKAKRSKDAILEDERKFVGVMIYDSKRFSKTGNWGFEAFSGNSKSQKIVKDAGVSCFSCHIGVEKQSFVFSKFRK